MITNNDKQLDLGMVRMQLKAFRIQDFRSIIDSTTCQVMDGITILAGKNESGKTNILDALEKINPGNSITETDYPKHLPQDHKLEPRIECVFKINDDEAEIFTRELIDEIEPEELTIIRTHKGLSYRIGNNSILDDLPSKLNKSPILQEFGYKLLLMTAAAETVCETTSWVPLARYVSPCKQGLSLWRCYTPNFSLSTGMTFSR